MFNRVHHQKILVALQAFDADVLAKTQCFFAGGTAISLCLDEYRESVDIDFLCASQEGFRLLRNSVGTTDLGALLKTPLPHAREVRADQYKIYTFLVVGDTKIKVEIVNEARVSLSGAAHPLLPVPVLSRPDLYTQKLLANDDRGLDKATMSRDIIDLAMMIRGWGDISRTSWDKAYAAYGDRLTHMFHQAVGMIGDHTYLTKCLQSMDMDVQLAGPIAKTLQSAASRLPLNKNDQHEFDRRLSEIPNLVQFAGALHTLGRHLSEASGENATTGQTDWAAAEMRAAAESIFEHHQPAESVVEAISMHSPGAVSKARQEVIARWFEKNLDQLEEEWLEQTLSSTAEKQGNDRQDAPQP